MNNSKLNNSENVKRYININSINKRHLKIENERIEILNFQLR